MGAARLRESTGWRIWIWWFLNYHKIVNSEDIGMKWILKCRETVEIYWKKWANSILKNNVHQMPSLLSNAREAGVSALGVSLFYLMFRMARSSISVGIETISAWIDEGSGVYRCKPWLSFPTKINHRPWDRASAGAKVSVRTIWTKEGIWWTLFFIIELPHFFQ